MMSGHPGLLARRGIASLFALAAVIAFSAAALAPAVAITMGRDIPAKACNGNGKDATAQDPPSLTILPAATGTLRWMPEFGIMDTPVGDAVQSSSFRTTSENREFRRGFAEFSIPEVRGRIVSATLLIPEMGGWVLAPRDPDRHVLSYYAADLRVDASDYDRPTRLLACFDTDMNVEHERFAFDVSHIVRKYEGGAVGFRLRLLVDPTYTPLASLGAGFQTNWNGDPIRIQIVTEV